MRRPARCVPPLNWTIPRRSILLLLSIVPSARGALSGAVYSAAPEVIGFNPRT